MVDDGDGQRLLHPLLADDVVVQVGDQLAGRGQLLELDILPLVLVEEAVADLDAVRRRCARSAGPRPTGTRALPSIIGPASAVVRPQKSQSTGAAGDGLSSVVSRLSLRIEDADRKNPSCHIIGASASRG